MNMTRWLSTMTVASLLTLTGFASAQTQPGVPHADMNKGLPAEVEEQMDLTDAQVKGFIAAAEELHKLDKDAKAPGNSASNPERFTQNLAKGQEALAIVEKHGFKDITEFQRVGYNAAMAYNVVKQGGKQAMKARLEKAEAQRKATLEKLRPHLTEEQFKMFELHADQSTKLANSMLDVPNGNVELMKKYSTQMDNLGKN